MLSNVLFSLAFTVEADSVIGQELSREVISVEERHGPEKPPPDDGYEFKGARGGNALGKIGLLMVGAGSVTTVMMLRAEKDSEERQNLAYTSGGLWLGGVALLMIERAS